eukprot:3796562-Ditylum_brightwellii.AAC.1
MLYSLTISTCIHINVDQFPARINKQNPSDDVNKTNKLGKPDNQNDGGDEFNEDYVGGNEGSKKSSLEGPTDKEDHQGDEETSKADCL